MSFIAKNKASLGRVVIAGTLAPSAATGFQTQQSQNDLFTVTSTAGQQSCIGLRIYELNSTTTQWVPGDFTIINVDWNGTQTQVATDMAAAIEAADIPSLPGSTFGDVLTITDNSDGTFNISTGSNYNYGVEYVNLIRLTQTPVTEGFDLSAYDGDAILMGTATGSDCRYLETGASPTTSVGIYVAQDAPFDIVGKVNILNAKIIEVTGTASVDYQIYIG